MKKGFTLIELLAVIVILAIIALIATPIIINIIEDSRKSSITESARLYISGLQNRILTENMTGEFNPSACNIINSNLSCDGESLDYQVNGQKPTSGIINFNNGSVTSYTLNIGGYTVTKDGDNITTTKGESVIPATIARAVYLDPTDLTAVCTELDAAQNLNNAETPTATGIKSGCMKFYIYSSTSTTYTMILDHNTSLDECWAQEDDFYAAGGTQSDWEASQCNMFGPISATARLEEDTVGWAGNPRLITADEVAHIVGIDTALGWDSTDSSSDWFYLDGSGSTYADWQVRVANAENPSNYAWLFDNLIGCSSRGCNVEDNNGYLLHTMDSYQSTVESYWTSTPYVNINSQAWMIVFSGSLDTSMSEYCLGSGIRPVITLPKSVIDN